MSTPSTAPLQVIEAGARADADRHQFSDRPLQFEAIPQVCLIADVCRILRLSEQSEEVKQLQRKERLIQAIEALIVGAA